MGCIKHTTGFYPAKTNIVSKVRLKIDYRKSQIIILHL